MERQKKIIVREKESDKCARFQILTKANANYIIMLHNNIRSKEEHI